MKHMGSKDTRSNMALFQCLGGYSQPATFVSSGCILQKTGADFFLKGIFAWVVFPFGKLTVCDGKSSFLMGESTISMAISLVMLDHQRVLSTITKMG